MSKFNDDNGGQEPPVPYTGKPVLGPAGQMVANVLDGDYAAEEVAMALEEQAAIEAGETEGLPDPLATPYMADLAARSPMRASWARRWRPTVLTYLRLCPVMTYAARKAVVALETIRGHMARDPQFAAAVTMAIEYGRDHVVGAIQQRAVEGYEKPVWHQGVMVGVERCYSDKLAVILAQALKPEQFDRAGRAKEKSAEAAMVGAEAKAADYQRVRDMVPLLVARQVATLAGKRPAPFPGSSAS